MIIVHTMRSDTPVDLGYFPRLGRRSQRVINVNDTNIPAKNSREIERILLSSQFTPPASHRIDELGKTQIEHYRDWIFINSTCCDFRALGKKAFFSEKVFVIGPQLLKDLCGETARSIGAEDKATARAYIRHAIAPLPHPGSASQFLTLARYNALQRLRSLTIHIRAPHDRNHFIRLNPRTVKTGPLPEEFSNLLRDIGLRVDQLQMDLELQANESVKGYEDPMKVMVDIVYPLLRALSARRMKGRVNP